MKGPSSLLTPGLAFLMACAIPAAMLGADDPPAQKPAIRDAASADKPPMVIQNPDGTITIQKMPSKGAKGAEAKKGLVIPPQVIIPIVSNPAKTNSQLRPQEKN